MSQNIEVGSLYDMNKQMFDKVPKMPQQAHNDMELKMITWMEEQNAKYFMLLCNERHDYTVFNVSDAVKCIKVELNECLDCRGMLLDIIDEGDKFEIWIRIDGDVYMYYFFQCDDFVIEV